MYYEQTLLCLLQHSLSGGEASRHGAHAAESAQECIHASHHRIHAAHGKAGELLAEA